MMEDGFPARMNIAGRNETGRHEPARQVLHAAPGLLARGCGSGTGGSGLRDQLAIDHR